MVTLFGLTRCDTMTRARRWLEAQGLEYRLHDYRQQGLSEAQVRAWAAELGWESLINRRGTTWRRLPAEVREALDEDAAVALLCAQPALLRRPLLDTGQVRHLGFSEAAYREIFGR